MAAVGSTTTAATAKPAQDFGLLFVVDVEATMPNRGAPEFPREIIELPCVCIDTRGSLLPASSSPYMRSHSFGKKIGEFHTFVQPTERPKLTRNCMAFSGISQHSIDRAPKLPEALLMLHDFVSEMTLKAAGGGDAGAAGSRSGGDLAAAGGVAEGSSVALGAGAAADPGAASGHKEPKEDKASTPAAASKPPSVETLKALSQADATSRTPCVMHGVKFTFAADGPFDLLMFMNQECERKKIPKPMNPPYLDKWVNTRWVYADAIPRAQQRDTVKWQLKKMGMRFEGTEHSGMDDTRHVARIACGLMGRGVRLPINDGVCKSMAVYFVPPAEWRRREAPKVPDAKFPPEYYGDGSTYK